MITNVKELEFGKVFEVRCYERGIWQQDKYVENIKEAIERMNFLCSEYGFKEDEVQLVELSFYGNVTDENEF